MCLILLAYRTHPRYHLVVAANRDEFFKRPAAPAAWWGDHPGLLAGRDLEAGGTWLGMTRSGRFAALTNFRDPPAQRTDAPSRGALVTGFLTGRVTPDAYLEALRPDAQRYNGFNLLTADRDALCGYSNRGDGVQRLAPGLHGISNGVLDEPWPKVTRGCADLGAMLADDAEPALEALFNLLSDRAQAPDEKLPDTGIGRDWERLLSARFIAAPGYGTRCSTVLLWGVDGEVRFAERSYDAQGRATGTVDVTFTLDLQAARPNS